MGRELADAAVAVNKMLRAEAQRDKVENPHDPRGPLSYMAHDEFLSDLGPALQRNELAKLGLRNPDSVSVYDIPREGYRWNIEGAYFPPGMDESRIDPKKQRLQRSLADAEGELDNRAFVQAGGSPATFIHEGTHRGMQAVRGLQKRSLGAHRVGVAPRGLGDANAIPSNMDIEEPLVRMQDKQSGDRAMIEQAEAYLDAVGMGDPKVRGELLRQLEREQRFAREAREALYPGLPKK